MKKGIDQTKVVFLDCDGVINGMNFFKSKYRERLRLSCGEQGDMIDPRAVKLLGDIYAATHCKFVMSSTWRHFYFGKNKREHYLAKPLRKLLRKYKIYIKDHTSFHYDREEYDKYCKDPENYKITKFFERGLQIDKWLKAHREVKNFVILDDSDLDLHLFGEHFIQTSWDKGLTSEDAKKAIKILNNKK